MSKNSASKTIGKIVSLIILILLLGVIAVTWFIGGQTKAIEKYCAAFASGDLKSMNKVTDIYSDQTDDKSFKQQQKDHFRSLPQFEELEDTDVISSDVDVKYHKSRRLYPMGMYDQGRLLLAGHEHFTGYNIHAEI